MTGKPILRAVPRTELYLISPPSFALAPFADALDAALAAGPVAAFQLRLKPAEDAAIEAAIQRLMPICARHGVPFLVNDRADLAARHGCDGAHVGQEDMRLPAARQLMGADATIGVSAYGSRHLAIDAAEAGADYVAFGPIFTTTTKPEAAAIDDGVDLVAWWAETMVVPVVAIGGIGAANLAPLVAARADFLAVVSAVWEHEAGPARGVEALVEAIARA